MYVCHGKTTEIKTYIYTLMFFQVFILLILDHGLFYSALFLHFIRLLYPLLSSSRHIFLFLLQDCFPSRLFYFTRSFLGSANVSPRQLKEWTVSNLYSSVFRCFYTFPSSGSTFMFYFIPVSCHSIALISFCLEFATIVMISFYPNLFCIILLGR